MNNELLSVVDKNDQVIKQLPRDEIHRNKLMHRAVHILVFNNDNHLFLQKRSMKKDLNKGLWDTSAAGHVDAGEHYLESAIREAREELGINLQQTLVPVFKLSPTPQLGMEFIQVYQARHNGPFRLAKDEIDEGQWLTMAEISQRVSGNDPTLTKTFKTIWKTYLNQSL